MEERQQDFTMSSKVDIDIETNIKCKNIANEMLRFGKEVSLKSIYEKIIELGSTDPEIIHKLRGLL